MVFFVLQSAQESAFNDILFLVSGNSSSSESDGSFDAEEFQRAVQDLSFELLGKKFFPKMPNITNSLDMPTHANSVGMADFHTSI